MQKLPAKLTQFQFSFDQESEKIHQLNNKNVTENVLGAKKRLYVGKN